MSSPTHAALPISVVIPAYNREHLLARALASVSHQRRRPAEVIVVDDGSTDATADVAARAGAHVVRLDRNGGAAKARNAGFEQARQPWIALLDSDDEWLPHCLEVLWSLRDDHVLVSGAQLSVGDDGRADRFGGIVGRREWVLRDPGPLIYPENFIVNSATLVRRDVVTEVGGYDASIRYSEDFDLWLRVLERGTGIATSTVVTVYHRHAQQKTKDVQPLLDAQRAIASAYAHRAWWRHALVEGRMAVRAWDELRLGRAGGGPRDHLRRIAWLGARPRRLRFVVEMLAWRLRGRRRSSYVGRDGRLSIAVLTDRVDTATVRAANPGATVTDISGAPWPMALASLVRRPRGVILVGSSRTAMLLRLLRRRAQPLRDGSLTVDRPLA